MLRACQLGCCRSLLSSRRGEFLLYSGGNKRMKIDSWCVCACRNECKASVIAPFGFVVILLVSIWEEGHVAQESLPLLYVF